MQSKKALLRIQVLLSLLPLFVIVACHGSCRQNPSQSTRLIVQMDGVPATTDSVQVNVSLNDIPSPKNPVIFNKQLSAFYLDFTAPNNQGNAIINIDAYAQQCNIATGRGQISLSAEPTATIHIALAPVSQVTCALIVSAFGPGKITSDPIGIDCGQQCRHQFPIGTTVTLSALPDISTSPYSWDGACSGSGSCTVKITASTMVSADFAPKVCTQPDQSWCWENPRPQGNRLSGVWIAPNPDQTLFAVGNHGTALIHQGVNWVSSATGTTNNLHAVWGTTPKNVYAVGDKGLIIHFDGTQWMPLVSQTTQNLFAVGGSSATDIWVAGDGATVLHGNGTSINVVTGVGVDTSKTGSSIQAFSPTDVWVAFNGAVSHWNGTNWTVSVNFGMSPIQLYGTASNDLLAVDVGGDTYKWNGANWSVLNKAPLTRDGFLGLGGVSTNTIWAVGGSFNPSGAIWRWDGLNWTQEPVSTINPLRAVYASGSSVVAVGDNGVVFQYDGTKWTNAGGQSVYSDFPAHRIWANNPNDLWAGGHAGKMWRGDGVGWTTIDTGATNDLIAVWGTGADDVWAVGSFGTIVRWNGRQWVSFPAPNGFDLVAINGTGPNDVWAAGKKTILRWTGGPAWVSMSPMPNLTGTIFAIYIGGSRVFICSPEDGIFQWDGQQWKQEYNEGCVGLHGIGMDTVYAISQNQGTLQEGILKRNANGQWDVIVDPVLQNFQNFINSIYVAAADDVWIVGGARYSTPIMAHWDGTSWTSIDSGMDGAAYAITGIGTKNLWLQGQYGSILRQRR